MNKNDAKKIAEVITNQELAAMFAAAKVGIKDWTKRSNVNKSMDKGTAWNILAKDFDANVPHHILAKINMIREFGEFLSSELKPKRKSKITTEITIHQKPIF
jgi:hypothetical protein